MEKEFTVQSFEKFCINKANRQAYFRTCQYLRKKHNATLPLVVCGANGSGKSHLMALLVKSYKEKYPDAIVVHIGVEEYIQLLISAVDINSFQMLFDACAKWSLLVIEDIYFLRKSARMCVFLINICNVVVRNGGKVIFTAEHECQLDSLFSRICFDTVSISRYSDKSIGQILRKYTQSSLNDQDKLAMIIKESQGDVRAAMGSLKSLHFIQEFTAPE